MATVGILNEFLLIGDFDIVNDNNIALISKVFSDWNLSIKQEKNQKNVNERVININDNNKMFNLTIKNSCITVTSRSLRDISVVDAVLREIQDLFNSIDVIINNMNKGNRIAIHSRFFVEDNDSNISKSFTSSLPIDHNIPSTELSFRLNQPFELLDETFNCITSVQEAIQNAQDGTKVKGMLVEFDVNTLFEKNENRFAMRELSKYYREMLIAIDNKIKLFK